MSLDPIRGRFILDVYKIGPGGIATPLTDFELRKLSSPAQAQAVLELMPTDVRISDVSLISNLGDVLPDSRVILNYQSKADPNYLDCFAIQCTVTIQSKISGEPATQGVMQYNVGELLWARQNLGNRKDSSTLTLDELGQLHFA